MSVTVINIENGSVVSNAQAINVNKGDMIEFSNDSDTAASISFSDDKVPLAGFKNPLSLDGNSKASFAVTKSSKAGEHYCFKCENDSESSTTISAKEPDGSIIIND